MRWISTLFFSLLFLIGYSQTKRALFLGNSYTAANNLPNLVKNIALSMGDTLIVDQNTPGGYTFQGHSTNATTLGKINQGNWDYVILQEQSQRPSFPISQVNSDVIPYAVSLDNTIHASDPCTKTMFYMTWGRKNGDASNCAAWPPICTYKGMDDLLRQRYMLMADSLKAEVSPVGAVWRYIRNNFPNIELYQPDESHPSLAGSYAAACSFYTAMYKKDPTAITFNSNLTKGQADTIKMAAKAVVLDSLLYWNIDTTLITASFTYNVWVKTVELYGAANNANSYRWIVEGKIYTTLNAVHIFPDTGVYVVRFEAINGCDTAFHTESIWIRPIGIESNLIQKIKIFPNPADGELYIEGLDSYSDYSYSILDLQGKEILKGALNKKIPLNGLTEGVYFLKISRDEQERLIRFMKK